MAFLRFASYSTTAAMFLGLLVPTVNVWCEEGPLERGVGVVTLVESYTLPAATRPHVNCVTGVGMRASSLPPSDAPADLVVLVDTSASQTGSYRTRAFDVVRGLFSSDARKEDRLFVAAIDSFFAPCSDSFKSRDDQLVHESLRRLEDRTPLGATDLVSGLMAAAGLFQESGGPKAIVYVGDGPSWTSVDPVGFAEAVDLLRSRRVQVSVAGIGPDVNWQVLTALASQTGGMVIVPEPHESCADVGRTLAGLAVEPVAWPIDTHQPAEDRVSGQRAQGRTANVESVSAVRVLPTRLPPLRADRDSIVLIGDGTEGEAAGFEMEFSFQTSKGVGVPVTVKVPKITSANANAFLAELFENANPTDGLFLPLLGSPGLEAAREHVLGEAASLAELSRQADEAGMRDSAMRLAEASLRRDPENLVALRVHTVAFQGAAPRGAAADGDAKGELPAPGPVAGAKDTAAADEFADLEQMRRVRAQQLEQETAVRIREARQLLAVDPDQSRELLKAAINEVRGSVDLEPAARDRLGRQLEMRIRESIVRSREKVSRDLDAERRASVGREQARLIASLQRREERLKQLVERYNALVEEGIRDGYAGSERYPAMITNEEASGYEIPTRALTDAERRFGDEIGKEAPVLWSGHPIPMPARALGRTAGLVARTLDYDAENFRTRRDQERGFMDVLHLVDVAAIPMPDEPSIIYPAAARWREINALRAEYRTPALNTLNAEEQKVYDSLNKSVGGKFEFTENSLVELATAVQDQFGITVVIDMPKVVDDKGLDVNEGIVTRRARPASLRAALRQILGPLDLTYLIKNEALVITTREAAEEPQNMVVRPYAVGDLVLPVDPMATINPFNLGGMNTQQQNQPLGGGAPPGGLCWVAREVYGLHDSRWLIFRDWVLRDAPNWLRKAYAAHGEAVADWIHDKPAVKSVIRWGMDAVVDHHQIMPTIDRAHLQLAAVKDRIEDLDHRRTHDREASVRREVSATDQAGDSLRVPDSTERSVAVGALPREVLEASDLSAALSRYLSPAPVSSDDIAGSEKVSRESGIGHGSGSDFELLELDHRRAQLRNTAATLGKAGEFQRAAALLSAAIRAGHGEPWMYESLALAMEAAGDSRNEVARAMLSSEDFATNSADLLMLANLLARMDFDAEALNLCKKITRLEPMNREAFALAMTVAGRNNDLVALAWACPGILACDWPAQHEDIAVRAARLAKSTIRQFEAEGRQAEAEALRMAVESASVRDLVMCWTWSGDAELDILVEEPSGTVCSVDVPRTTSGGTFVAAETSEAGMPAHKQCYSAAVAFPGIYRVRLRKICGTIESDTVHVLITANRGTPAERTETQRIGLAADDHFLQIDLGGGRRRNALPEAQLAQDVVLQRAIGKAVLMQQLELLAEDAVRSDFAASRSNTAASLGAGSASFFGRGGSVGYQPTITTLPEGLNHSARVVVSADRRYVRVTCAPLFSGVGQITTFSFQGGGGGGGGDMGGGDMGGGGMGGGGMGGGGMGGGGMGGGGMGGGGMGGGGMGGMGGGMGGGGMGGMGGGGMGGLCWVAREVYGPENPRWLLFREWMVADAPTWFRDVYAARGEAFAAWIHDKPALKAGLRWLMDLAIASRSTTVEGP